MKKTIKARKYNSPKLQALMGEITSTEMEQTKVKMQLAARIEDMMLKRGWSKSEFAEKVNKNPSEITKWFSGTQNFTTDILTEIACAFGVEVATLFGKNNVSVINRVQLVVHSNISQQAIRYTTPVSQVNDISVNYFSGRNQRAKLPLTTKNKK